ncbi:MAG TPA: cytochrome C, partial [Ramlibacter sp.]
MQKRMVLLVAAATAAGLGVAGALAAAAVIYGGLYDVSATGQHLQATHTVLETAMRQAVRLRAREIPEPPLADER